MGLTLSFGSYTTPAKFSDPAEVIELGLDDCGLSEIPRKLPKLFPNLQMLLLRRNKIKAWPDFITEWKALKEVDIGGIAHIFFLSFF